MNSIISGTSQASTLSAPRINHVKDRKELKKKKQMLPEKIKNDVTYFAWMYGISKTRGYSSSKYPQYEFKGEKIIS